MAFFNASSLPVVAQKAATGGPRCEECKKFKGAEYPKQFTPTLREGGVVVVHSGPSDRADGHARPEGDLMQILGRVDILDKVDFLGVVACPSDKTTIQDAGFCRPWFSAALSQARPRAVIPIGQEAISSVIGHLWGVEAGFSRKWTGRQIPDQTLNAWVCPIARGDAAVREIDNLCFNLHLREAVKTVQTGKRPWNSVPDFKSQIEVIYDPREAAKIVREMIEANPRASAFDYECTGLKPEHPKHKIYSCSIAWGNGRWPDRCVAFPWVGEVIKAVSEYLRSPIPKIAQNAKFEERWTIRKLGHRVRKWIWCTQLAAHWEDPTEDTKGLEFQAYANLGFKQWASAITPYLEAERANSFNKIQQAPLGDLLLYNGLDSFLEYAIAWKQWKRNGLDYEKVCSIED